MYQQDGRFHVDIAFVGDLNVEAEYPRKARGAWQDGSHGHTRIVTRRDLKRILQRVIAVYQYCVE